MNRSNERERLVFVRLTKLRRSAQAKYERNSIQALDAPNSQRCIVMFPSFVSTLSYGSGRITKIWPFLLWWWIYGREIFARVNVFFCHKNTIAFISYSLFVHNTHTRFHLYHEFLTILFFSYIFALHAFIRLYQIFFFVSVRFSICF